MSCSSVHRRHKPVDLASEVALAGAAAAGMLEGAVVRAAARLWGVPDVVDCAVRQAWVDADGGELGLASAHRPVRARQPHLQAELDKD